MRRPMLLVIPLLLSLALPAVATDPGILVITVDGVISPVTVEYLDGALEQARDGGYRCLVMELDTPGGLLESARQAVQLIMNSELPVVTYVSPRGARAGSAGVFLTLASHVAAMAPATNIGAAHPVQLPSGLPGQGDGSRLTRAGVEEVLRGLTEQPKEPESGDEPPQQADHMSDKIVNDTVAWVRGIARARNRNEEWAVLSVVESDSITAGEALEMGVIDLVADNLEDLLAQIHGRRIELPEGEVTLETRGAPVERRAMTSRQRLLSLIVHPEIIALLLAVGGLGILIELTHPGVIFPGVVGVLSLILGLYAVQVIPVNLAGVLLILVAFVLFLLEVKVPSYGLLTVGGVTAMIVGGLMLVDSRHAWMEVPGTLIVSIALGIGLLAAALVTMVVRVHRRQVVTGSAGMLGKTGKARTALAPSGLVFVEGMIWRAESDRPVAPGDRIRVVSMDGLYLKVCLVESEPKGEA